MLLAGVVATSVLGPLATGQARAADMLVQRLQAARDAAAAQPRDGIAQLQALRKEALTAGRLDQRLAADEGECRVVSDVDAVQAIAVADAGLAAAGRAPTGDARDWWLRLRACRAGMLVETGRIAEGRKEFDALLALAIQPGDAVAQALARLERGVHRSRSGDFRAGQEDLIPACEVLGRLGAEHDHDLCVWHMANHYRRVGDDEEALRMMFELRDGARRRGASYDVSIYTFGIGQAHQEQRRWTESLESFREAVLLNERLEDPVGVAYAEQATARSLLALKRPQEALTHVTTAVRLLDPAADPRQNEVQGVTLAEALVALGQPAEANVELDRVMKAVRARGEQPTLQRWLVVRAGAMSALSRWDEAYKALDEAAVIDTELAARRLSEQSARVRMQFNRARDAENLARLRRLNEQGQALLQTQAIALVLFVALLGIVLFVAARKFRQARRLQGLASTDELTGLANRRALLAFLDQALEQARRGPGQVSVLMIDVDHFKRINDTRGHAVGDAVLRHLALVLAAGVREHDRLGRIGGEEFLVVLPGASLTAAQAVAERMRAAIAASPLAGPGAPVDFTVSIGVARGDGAQKPDELLSRADAALYRAKDAGRNAVVADLAPIDAMA